MRIEITAVLAMILASTASAEEARPPVMWDPVAIAAKARSLVGTWVPSGNLRWLGPEVEISDLGSGRLAIASDKGRFAGVALYDGTTLAAITHDRTGQWGHLRASLTREGKLAIKLFGDSST